MSLHLLPAAPAGPEQTRKVTLDLWGATIDRRYDNVLHYRANRIHEMRIAGDPREADIVAWLSLAGILSGIGAETIKRLLRHPDPPAALAAVATAIGDGPVPALAPTSDPPPALIDTPFGFPAIVAASPAAQAVCDLAGRATTRTTVAVEGRNLATSIVIRAVAARLRDVTR